MQDHTLTCTFCRKSEQQVEKLVAGPGVYICDGCIEIAHRIVHADGAPQSRWRRGVARIAGLLRSARGRFGRVVAEPVS